MANFDRYKDAFPHAKLTRSPDGVLEVVLHTDGGSLLFNGYVHEEFVELFHEIGQDPITRVVILTGAGDAFIEIVPRDRLLARARELAARIVALPPLTSSYTRVVLTQTLRRIIDESVGYGLALEGISAADVKASQSPPSRS